MCSATLFASNRRHVCEYILTMVSEYIFIHISIPYTVHIHAHVQINVNVGRLLLAKTLVRSFVCSFAGYLTGIGMYINICFFVSMRCFLLLYFNCIYCRSP